MLNQQTLKGNWNELSGKIHEKWGQLTDDELQQFKGNVAQLVGYIQRKTGESRSDIEKFLDEATANGAATMSRVAEKSQEYVNQAADAAKDAADAMAEHVRDGYENAEKLVQRRPGESVAVAFGAGLMAGVLVALLVRSR
jgi:uncharacterized protein YjbJ (UPF0337 family)